MLSLIFRLLIMQPEQRFSHKLGQKSNLHWFNESEILSQLRLFIEEHFPSSTLSLILNLTWSFLSYKLNFRSSVFKPFSQNLLQSDMLSFIAITLRILLLKS